MNDTNNKSNGDVVYIDAYNLMYRAFHGTKQPMTNQDGIPTNAVFTVMKMLLKFRNQFDNIKFALAVFDGSGGSDFRKEIDPEYKANRKEMPPELKVQLPYIVRAFEVLGFKTYKATIAEADDVIGTMAVRSSKNNFDTYIISSDKDFRAIISDNLFVIDSMNDIKYDKQTLLEKKGILPSQVTDYLALLGDGADNVKGIDKVGDITAVKLLTKYNNIEGIKNNLHEIKGVVGANLKKAFDDGTIEKNIKLIQLKLDLDLSFKKKEMVYSDINEEGFDSLCQELNIKSLNIKRKPKI